MSKWYVQAGWADVPHISEEQREEYLRNTAPHQRDARSKGIPSMGEGLIYPIHEDDFVIDSVKIQPWWRRVYAIDPGYRNTAVVWVAHDTDTDIVYVYDCFKKHNIEPDEASVYIKHRDIPVKWPGVIDPAALGGSQDKGQKNQLLKLYNRNGLRLRTADNAVEAGIQEVWGRFKSDRLKVIRNGNTEALLSEMRKYRRDDKGRIVKENDHLMDALRYAIVTGLKYAKPVPRAPVNASGGARNYGL